MLRSKYKVSKPSRPAKYLTSIGSLLGRDWEMLVTTNFSVLLYNGSRDVLLFYNVLSGNEGLPLKVVGSSEVYRILLVRTDRPEDSDALRTDFPRTTPFCFCIRQEHLITLKTTFFFRNLADPRVQRNP